MDGLVSTPVRFGHYELLQKLRQGGRAVVHRAVFCGTNGFVRPVVIKQILPQFVTNEDFGKIFIEKVKRSALLNHPNIVQIQDFGTIDRTFFFAMEYIEGITLENLMDSYGLDQPIPPPAAAYIMQGICQGLGYAHSLPRNGKPMLIHRDVSPNHIMISANGVVKLLDFGMDECLDREGMGGRTYKGKYSYISPEQAVGQPATPRSDIFSAGIVFWELLTGRRLFKAQTDYLTLCNVVRTQVPPPSAFRSDLPPIFNAICRRALARKPNDRFATAKEMAEQLGYYLEENPCSAAKLAEIVGIARGERPPLPTEKNVEKRSAPPLEPARDSFRKTDESISSLVADQEEPIVLPLKWKRTIPAFSSMLLAAALVIFAISFIIRPPKGSKGISPSAPSSPGKVSLTTSALPKDQVMVYAVSQPSGAVVDAIGETEARGTTPLVVKANRSTSIIHLRASLPGYVSQERAVVPTRHQTVSFLLIPKAPEQGSPPQQPDSPYPSAPLANQKAAKSNREKKASIRLSRGVTDSRMPANDESALKDRSKNDVKEKYEPPVFSTFRGDALQPATPPEKPPNVPDLKEGDLADPYAR